MAESNYHQMSEQHISLRRQLDSNPAATLVHQWQRPLHRPTDSPNQWEADLAVEVHLQEITRSQEECKLQHLHQEAESLGQFRTSQNYKGL